jgi:hypothetical protein
LAGKVRFVRLACQARKDRIPDFFIFGPHALVVCEFLDGRGQRGDTAKITKRAGPKNLASNSSGRQDRKDVRIASEAKIVPTSNAETAISLPALLKKLSSLRFASAQRLLLS